MRGGANDAVTKAQPDQLRASGGPGARLALESAGPPSSPDHHTAMPRLHTRSVTTHTLQCVGEGVRSTRRGGSEGFRACLLTPCCRRLRSCRCRLSWPAAVDLPAIVTTKSDVRRVYRVAPRADALSRARASIAVRHCCIPGAGGHLDWSTPRAAITAAQEILDWRPNFGLEVNNFPNHSK